MAGSATLDSRPVRARVLPRPNGFNLYRSEFIKWRSSRFLQIVVFGPLVAAILASALLLLLKAANVVTLTQPNLPSSASLYKLGSGTFALADFILTNVASFYTLILVVACSLVVAQELSWHTIKMIATRQPSRTTIVAVKFLFCLTLVLIVSLALLLGWFVLGMTFKAAFNLPLELNSTDFEAIGNGIANLGLLNVLNLVWISLAVGLTFYFRSIVGGIVGYFVWNQIDSILTTAGAAYNAYGDQIPSELGVVKPFLEIIKFLNPFFINGSHNRLLFGDRALSPELASVSGLLTIPSNPVWLAWLVVAVYIAVFVGLAIWVFNRRDIVE